MNKLLADVLLKLRLIRPRPGQKPLECVEGPLRGSERHARMRTMAAEVYTFDKYGQPILVRAAPTMSELLEQLTETYAEEQSAHRQSASDKPTTTSGRES